MKYLKLIVLLNVFCIGFISCVSNQKVCEKYPRYKYYLYDSFDSSDIDITKIGLLDTMNRSLGSVLEVFSPIPGNYKVLRYLSYDYQLITIDITDSVNYVMILKVDSTNTVKDGYIVYPQLSEGLPSCNLLKVSKNTRLTSEIKVKKMKFKHVPCDCEDQALMESLNNRKKYGIVFSTSVKQK